MIVDERVLRQREARNKWYHRNKQLVKMCNALDISMAEARRLLDKDTANARTLRTDSPLQQPVL